MSIRRPIQRPIRRRTFLAGSAIAGATLLLPAELLAQENCKVLNFYNWDTYIGPDTLEKFTKETGIEVKYDLYADNDELFAKLKNGNPGYDLIVPSNDYTERMIKAGMLEPLDLSKIPNVKNIDPQFMDPAFDPGRKYSLPYMWGTVGLGYRKSAFDEPPKSWTELLKSDKYSGRFAALSDASTMLQIALLIEGRDVNDWSDENVALAEKIWTDAKKNVVAFANDNGQDLLMSGEVDIAIEYNGDILQAQEEDEDIAFIVPEEGTIQWEDTLAIPKGAPCPEAAHKMIDFMLGAQEGAAIAEEIAYATPNKAALANMDEDYRTNPAIFPNAETMSKIRTSKAPSVEEARKIDAAWTRVKAAD